MWRPLTSGTLEGIQSAQAIGAILGPVVGAVIGYYFGSARGERTAREASRRADQASHETEAVKEVSDSELDRQQRLISETLDVLRRLRSGAIETPTTEEGEPGAES